MRKKHPRLPNGYGSIRYLGKGRTLPFAVHPPAQNVEGRFVRPKPLCYVPDWYTGLAVLSAYHAGNYRPGIEIELKYSDADIDGFCRKVIAHGVYSPEYGLSVEKVYKSFIEDKFGEYAPVTLSASTLRSYEQGYKYLEPIKDKNIKTVRLEELQTIVNRCDKTKSTRHNIIMCAKNIWRYALAHDMIEKDIAQFLKLPEGNDCEHGIPLTDEELKKVWKDDSPVSRLVLILCYSGFRISAFESMEINLEEMYFRGGVKNKTSKNRIVPIHSCIQSFTKPFPKGYKKMISEYLAPMNHTAHDCRHTFSMLCERYGVREADRKRLLGHSFGADITNAIYSHRTLEELRTEIEKIKAPV